MHDENVTDDTYPALFHVGFLVESYEAVHERHRRIVKAGFDAPEPAILKARRWQDLRILYKASRHHGRGQLPRSVTA